MPANKRTKTEIARDREIVGRMYLEGKQQAEISEYLNARDGIKYSISREQVKYDLDILRKEWVASGVRDFDAAKAEELTKIDNLEREYWDAWRNSLGTNIELIERKFTEGSATDTTKKIKELNGDPRYLEGVRWCIERRCKILGLDAPEKKELTILDKDPSEMTEAELEAAIDSLEQSSAVH